MLSDNLPSDAPATYRDALFFRIRRRNVAILSGILLVVATILYGFNPEASSASSVIYPPSPSRLLTGLYCPGCGTLRGLHQLLHGKLGAAFGYNPLMVLSLPFMAIAYVRYSLPALTRHKIKPIFIQPRIIWWILRIVLVYWVLRNIPHPLFAWMAP